MPDVAQTPTIGETLGHYRILTRVGAGGMGEVYRARDQRLERDVALKVLPAGTMRDEVVRRRFRKEALALSRLNHPNIQTVYDFDTQRGVDFLTTEFVEGVTLTDRLAEGPLPVEEIVSLGVQLAAGLEAAHERRIVHRDLKPSNLRVTPDGRLKILDFGLARQLHPGGGPETADEPTRSASDTLALPGTLPYMAPELLRGALADPRSDVYAAGVTLFMMATGQRPFQGPVPLVLMEAIVHGPTPAPRRLRPDLPPALEAIILRCLEKNPDERYQSARELQSDLKALEPSASGAGLLPPFGVRRKTRLRGLGLAALTLLAALLATRLDIPPETPAPGGAESSSLTSLAVLPLEDLSRDPGQAYFASGLTEALTTNLGRIHALRVVSRTSAGQFEGAKQPVAEIGRALGVDGVVEGSVLRIDDQVQVTVRLIHASSDTQLWAQSFERDVEDVFNLQRELALAIAAEIRTTVTPGEQARLASTAPVNPGALEAYLQGNHLRRGTSEQRLRARQYYEEAVTLDPDYAPGYAGLADSYWSALDLPPREAMARAKDFALKAVALDDALPHAHKALASVIFYGDWDWEGAEREYRRALDLNPSDAEAHRMFSVYLSAMDRPREALREMRTAGELDPLSLLTAISEGWTRYYARDFDAAIERCGSIAGVDPSSVGAHGCLGAAHLARGESERGLEECRRAVELSGGDPVQAVDLARGYALVGQRSEARRTLDALRLRSREHYVPRYFQAVILGALGARDEAFAELDRAYDERDLYLAWLKVDPAADPLRSDPRFAALLRRLGLAPSGA